jgi:ankyrin repeat protein
VFTPDNVNAETKAGNTPLQIAAGRNATESVAMLLQQGAEVDHRNHSGDTR